MKRPATKNPARNDDAIADQWAYAYDADTRRACRRKIGAKKSDHGEDGEAMRVPEKAGPSYPMEAVRCDGTTRRVPQTT
eukprot:3096429-Pyramimonas_sp.AAC.1